MNINKLTQFTNPEILKSIGANRLNLLLHKFAQPISAANAVLPPPDGEKPESFTELAAALGTQLLPSELEQTLHALETAALPQNAAWLEDARQRRIPCVSVPSLKIDLALEIFFAAPDELARCKPALSVLSHPSSGSPLTPDPCLLSPPPGPPSVVSPQASDPPLTSDPCLLSPPPGPPSDLRPQSSFAHLPPVEPWDAPVDGKELLDEICHVLNRFVVLPKWAAETISLWVLHTYAFELRDVSTYLGIESPARRCGKTTLLTILCRLVHRPVVAANVSSPAFYRAIEELRPTLMIDEADTFLKGNDELKGILNAGYKRDTAFVLRVNNQTPNSAESASSPQTQLAFFSCWCPKIISRIGKLPETLADRCILIRMHRKTAHEECERLRNLETNDLRRKCVRFVKDNVQSIAAARPSIPKPLNDRAADIWEPLLAIADLAGSHWSDLARQAAIALSASHEINPIGSLFLDILCAFIASGAGRFFTRDLVTNLNYHLDRPWGEARNGKPITDIWLSQQLAPYGIRSRTIWIGDAHAKGYLAEDFHEVCRRYVSRAEYNALLADRAPKPESEPNPSTATDQPTNLSQETDSRAVNC